MKTCIAPLQTILITTILFVAASAFALPITPVSYDMKNGTSGSYTYWDDSYSGSGNRATNGAQLSGGLGDLTDGIIANQHMYITEAPAGPGPYVGWNASPTIVFHFGSAVNLNSLALFLDDRNGVGGVSLPGSVTLSMGGIASTYSVFDDPALATPIPVSLSNLGFIGDTLTLTLNRKNNTGWVFLSEVGFDGTYATTQSATSSPVPEPGTMLLLGSGLVGLAGYRLRRKHTS